MNNRDTKDTRDNRDTRNNRYTRDRDTRDTRDTRDRDTGDNKKIVHKAGRTILIKTNDTIVTDTLDGLVNAIQTNNGNTFLVFDTIDNSQLAFKILKQKYKVKFAHYRVFFTMTGLEDTVDYNELKKTHIDWITLNSNAEVLYYKQYKKNNQYLGCGDFTIDTKESLDKLLNKSEHKIYSFNNYSGTHYRYNKKNDSVEKSHVETL